MNAQIENTAHLNSDDVFVARAARNIAQHQCKSLDDAEKQLRFYFKGWFIYRGGNHIAMHRASGDDRRVLFVTEA